MTSTRAKLQAEYEQALFKVLLHDAAEQEGRALLEELDDAGHSPAHAPSELELKRFGKELDKRQRRQRQAGWKKATRIGERMFMLKTQTTVDTAIRMARGVKFVE